MQISRPSPSQHNQNPWIMWNPDSMCVKRTLKWFWCHLKVENPWTQPGLESLWPLPQPGLLFGPHIKEVSSFCQASVDFSPMCSSIPSPRINVQSVCSHPMPLPLKNMEEFRSHWPPLMLQHSPSSSHLILWSQFQKGHRSPMMSSSSTSL